MDKESANILVVDDDTLVLDTLTDLLQNAGFSVTALNNGRDAIEEFKKNRYAVVIIDINMPETDGIVLLRQIHEVDPDMPVIMMTGFPEFKTVREAMRNNAYDFFVKPLKMDYVLDVVKNAIFSYEIHRLKEDHDSLLEKAVKEKTDELREAIGQIKAANLELIFSLTRASEYKDEDSVAHINRIAYYSKLIARSLGMDAEFAETIAYASPMHDIGKIGIPDNILFKHDVLTADEFEISKQHTRIGAQILGGSNYPILQMAERIALTHHERWDGSGYPEGLKGEEIPLEGRIVMLVDHYDGLRTERPYKSSFSHAETYEILTTGNERIIRDHFDPEILEGFKKVHREFEELYEELEQKETARSRVLFGQI